MNRRKNCSGNLEGKPGSYEVPFRNMIRVYWISLLRARGERKMLSIS
jgi:hypothetical protein